MMRREDSETQNCFKGHQMMLLISLYKYLFQIYLRDKYLFTTYPSDNYLFHEKLV